MGRFPRSRAHPLEMIAVAAGWIWSLAHLVRTGILQSLGNSYSDFLATFPAHSVAARMGRLDMWRGSVAEEWCWGHLALWHYGPILHLITLPLFAFPTLHSAYVAWLYVNVAVIFGIAIIAIGIIDDWRPSIATATLVVLVVFNFNPLYEGLSQRVIEIPELLLLLGAFALQKKDKRFAAGFLVGLAAMTKFLPLIYLPYFVLKRNWRALAGAAAAIVPVAAATEWLLDWRNSGILFQLRRGTYIAGGNDQSLPGHAISLLRGWLPFSAQTIGRAAISCGLALVCVLYIRTRTCKGVDDLEWATLAVAMILLAPHSENYYLLLLVFAFLPALSHYREWPSDLLSIRGAVFSVAFLLTAIPIPFALLTPLFGPHAFQRYVGSHLPFAGELLLAAANALTLLRACHGGDGFRTRELLQEA